MFRKMIFGAAASATALTAFVALPAPAEAQRYRDGYYRDYGNQYRHRRHRSNTRIYVNLGPGYYDPYYGRGYYGPAYYDRGYYGRAYYNRGYYRGGYRCDDGATGAIVGGAAGALVGREIGRDGRRYRYGRYGRGGDGTTGAILGGVIGALVGREATRC